MLKKKWLFLSLLLVVSLVTACSSADNSAELAAAQSAAATAEAKAVEAQAMAAAAEATAQAAQAGGASQEELAAAKAEAEAALQEAEAAKAEAAAVIQEAEAAQAEADEATVADEESASFLAADGLVACNDLPDLASLMTGAGGLASPIDISQARGAAMTVRQPEPGPALAPSASPAQQTAPIYQVGVFEDVTSLNFWGANGPDNTIWNSYMLPPRPSLYALAHQRFDFVPMVAVDLPEPLTQEGDFWVTAVPIREDLVWSDGEPFTAVDVAFTANAALKLGLIAGNWGQWYDGNYLDHVEATEDYVVKYYYHTKPGLARHEWGSLQAPILAEHYWTPLLAEAVAPIDALGDNPEAEALTAAQAEAHDNLFAVQPDGEPFVDAFLLSEWEPGAFFENQANPNYYDANKTVTLYANGAYEESDGTTLYGDPTSEVELTYDIGPFVDAAIYSIYGTQDAAILALQNGEVDFVLNSLGLQRGLADRIRNDANLSVIENPDNGYRYMSFNVRRRPMNDCAFRQAVAVLIDKEFVSSTILQGTTLPVYSFISEANAAWYSDDVLKLGQGLNREQRLTLAMAILEQAGYTWQDDQKPVWDADGGGQVIPAGRLLMPDGTPVPALQLWAPSAGYDSLRTTFAIWTETWLNEVGIPVEANLAGFNTLIPRIFTEQDFDMYILGWSLSIFPSSLNDFFTTEQAVPDGNNAGGYANPEYDALAAELLTCDTPESCKAIADNLQQMLAMEMPYVLLYTTPVIEAYRNDAVTYPYEANLAGLQYSHLPGLNGSGLQTSVRVK